MASNKVRKKDSVLDAILYLGDNFDEVQAFVGDVALDNSGSVMTPGFDSLEKWLNPRLYAEIVGLAALRVVDDNGNYSWTHVAPGWYILRSTNGLLSAVSPEVFLLEYEDA